LILHLFIARFYVCDYPGVEDDGWLLGADEDSPVLNNAAVAAILKRVSQKAATMLWLLQSNCALNLCCANCYDE
jgi:hypothetical protein